LCDIIFGSYPIKWFPTYTIKIGTLSLTDKDPHLKSNSLSALVVNNLNLPLCSQSLRSILILWDSPCIVGQPFAPFLTAWEQKSNIRCCWDIYEGHLSLLEPWSKTKPFQRYFDVLILPILRLDFQPFWSYEENWHPDQTIHTITDFLSGFDLTKY